jgi:hypothetical protein
MRVLVRDRGVVDGADLGIVVGEPVDLALPGGENIDDVALPRGRRA